MTIMERARELADGSDRMTDEQRIVALRWFALAERAMRGEPWYVVSTLLRLKMRVPLPAEYRPRVGARLKMERLPRGAINRLGIGDQLLRLAAEAYGLRAELRRGSPDEVMDMTAVVTASARLLNVLRFINVFSNGEVERLAADRQWWEETIMRRIREGDKANKG
jgi:hypothetical protein